VEKINSKKELIEKLKDVLAVEIDAKNRYEEDDEAFKNYDLKFTIEEIIKDEEEHINMLNSLIKMLESESSKETGTNLFNKSLVISFIFMFVFGTLIFFALNQNQYIYNKFIGNSIKNNITSQNFLLQKNLISIIILVVLFIVVLFYLFRYYNKKHQS
jgi:hypothetical protein